jgi:hypothetical protein
MGRVVLGSGGVLSGCRVKNLGPRPTRDMVGLGLGFLVIIFGLDQPVTWLGQVWVFFWVRLGCIGLYS